MYKYVYIYVESVYNDSNGHVSPPSSMTRSRFPLRPEPISNTSAD